MGNDPLFPDFYPESLLALFKNSEIEYSWEEDIKISIWSKYIFIAAFGLVTATYDKTLGEVLDSPELSRITKAIMSEIEKIARKINVPLNSDIVESSFLKAKQFPYEAKTSFQRDVELKGKINEIDLFGGTLIRYGERYNIPIPDTKNIYEKFMRKTE